MVSDFDRDWDSYYGKYLIPEFDDSFDPLSIYFRQLRKLESYQKKNIKPLFEQLNTLYEERDKLLARLPYAMELALESCEKLRSDKMEIGDLLDKRYVYKQKSPGHKTGTNDAYVTLKFVTEIAMADRFGTGKIPDGWRFNHATVSKIRKYLHDMSPAQKVEEERMHNLEDGFFDKLIEIDKKHVELRNRIIEGNLGLVVKIAQPRRFVSRHIDFLDLINEGNVGLIDALESYDPSTGYDFSTYADYCIKGRMNTLLVRQDDYVPLPTNKGTKIRKSRVGTRTISFDAGLGEEGDMSLHDVVADTYAGNDPVEQVNMEQRSTLLQTALRGLQGNYSRILRDRFSLACGGEREGMTQVEIGEREGVSKQAIKQREDKGVKELKEILSNHLAAKDERPDCLF